MKIVIHFLHRLQNAHKVRDLRKFQHLRRLKPNQKPKETNHPEISIRLLWVRGLQSLLKDSNHKVVGAY